MTVGFYSAEQGVLNMQKGMDITANNIANVSTNGFKPMRASFSDLIYTKRRQNKEEVETGHGVKLDKTDLMFDVGAPVSTGGALDYATPSEGFFAVQNSDGNYLYTKDGSFDLSQSPDGDWYLVNSKGDYVLDYDYNPIIAEFDENGKLITEGITENLGVFSFENPYGLELEGDNYFSETLRSGAAMSNDQLEKKNGYLEMSSVNMANEMVNIIQYQKAFSVNAKMVQAADEIENTVNSLR